MKPTQILVHEHEVIRSMLTCLERMVERATRDGRLPTTDAVSLLEFFQRFADGCHHRKEEDLLFPALEQRGLLRNSGPLAVMRVEHERGRMHVRGMAGEQALASAGDLGALRRFAEHARAFCVLLREHIDKENDVLFPLAARVLEPAAQAALGAEFERLEQAAGDTHAAFLRRADDLCRRYGAADLPASCCTGLAERR